MNTTQKSSGVHRFATFVAICTFFLLCAGALVTSTGSGLAVPDWPLSYGQFFPPMIGGILFEHGHRMIAGFVGFLALLLMASLLWKENRRWVRWMGIAAFLVVIAQALLGGITVLFMLPDPISISHAGLAEIFFSLVVSLVLFTSPRWMASSENLSSKDSSQTQEKGISLKFLSLMMTLMIYVQILLGAYFRHSGLGIWAHVFGAFGVIFFVGWMGIRVLRKGAEEKFLVKWTLLLLILMSTQLILGPVSLIAKMAAKDFIQPQIFKVTVTVIHLALGALMLVTSLAITLWNFRLKPLKKAHLLRCLLRSRTFLRGFVL
ncbi:MAG: heme A synthase [Chlamydiae bacterium]|nr:heme A synthase [Chlamydiota bacterium]MBI3277247.1 heme A synthase [Chlamydiota bacterium]